MKRSSFACKVWVPKASVEVISSSVENYRKICVQLQNYSFDDRPPKNFPESYSSAAEHISTLDDALGTHTLQSKEDRFI